MAKIKRTTSGNTRTITWKDWASNDGYQAPRKLSQEQLERLVKESEKGRKLIRRVNPYTRYQSEQSKAHQRRYRQIRAAFGINVG